MCSIGLKSPTVLGKSSSPLRDWNQNSRVRKYFVLSFASILAVKTSLHNLANVVQYVLFDWSKARSTRLILGPWSWSKMLFKFAALFFQNSISTYGVGCRPCFSCDSGSCFSTLRICFVHVMIAPSSKDILFFPVLGPPERSIGGMGSLVSPFIWPQRMVVLDRKLWNRSIISLVGTSPHFAWFWGFESTGKNTSFASNSRCSKGLGPLSSVTTIYIKSKMNQVNISIFYSQTTLTLRIVILHPWICYPSLEHMS